MNVFDLNPLTGKFDLVNNDSAELGALSADVNNLQDALSNTANIANQALEKANTSTKLVGSLYFMASNTEIMNSIPSVSNLATCANNENGLTYYWNNNQWNELPAAWAKLNKFVLSIDDRDVLVAFEGMTCGVIADGNVYQYVSGSWTLSEQPVDEIGDMFFIGSFYGTWNNGQNTITYTGNATAQLSHTASGWMWAVSESTDTVIANSESEAWEMANSGLYPNTWIIFQD